MIASPASNYFRWIGSARMARSNLPAVLGLLLPFAALAGQESSLLATRFVVFLLVSICWQAAFRQWRGLKSGSEGLINALLLALLTPSGVPYWQLVIGASFGIVMGELVFGGRGRSFVHPVVVALGFLMFSFPGEAYRTGPQLPLWTLAPAAILLCLSGQATWRVLVSAAIGILLLSWGIGADDPFAILLDGKIWLSLLFLASDPVASASTNTGRLIYGALIGVLAVLFSLDGGAFGGIVPAILVSSIFAPLIDQCVILLSVWRRERRHG